MLLKSAKPVPIIDSGPQAIALSNLNNFTETSRFFIHAKLYSNARRSPEDPDSVLFICGWSLPQIREMR